MTIQYDIVTMSTLCVGDEYIPEGFKLAVGVR